MKTEQNQSGEAPPTEFLDLAWQIFRAAQEEKLFLDSLICPHMELSHLITS